MTAVLPIQLRLFYAGGGWRDELWAILGDDFVAGTTLSLPLPGESERFIELFWQHQAWLLRNRSTRRLVFVNQVAVGPGQFYMVNVDDRIEVGNCRFRVERRDPAQLALARNILAETLTPAQSILSQRSPDEGPVDGDLFDLIPQTPISIVPEIPELSPETALTSPAAGGELIREAGKDEEISEMRRLEAAYFNALLDPNARLEAKFGEAVAHERFIPPEDSSGAINIEEMLSGEVDVDTLMHRLNPLGGQPVGEHREDAEVLMLFAGDAPTHQGQSLPSRTRHDHHLMSLNSEYRLFAGTQPPKREDAE